MNKKYVYLFILNAVLFLHSCANYNNNHHNIIKNGQCGLNLLQSNFDDKVNLKGGLSKSTIYKVSKDHTKYVIRNISHRSDDDKMREVEAQVIASQEEYGPKIYAYDIENGKILMEFLEETSTSLTGSKKAKKLAKLLLKIHNGSSYKDHISILKQTKKLILNKIKKLPKGIKREKIIETLDLVEEIPTKFKKPTHRDLNFNNILFTKRGYRVIDYENAGQDDPFYDLATIIIFNFYNTDLAEEFLAHYFNENLNKKEQARLDRNIKLALIHYGLSIIKKLPKSIMSKNVKPIKLNNLLEDFRRGDRSTESSADLLILAKSMLFEAS